MSEHATRQVPSGSKAIGGFAVFLAAVVVVAGLGGLAVTSAGVEYARLTQPSWAPAASVFGPVWTVLYLSIAVSGWLVWRGAGLRGARSALVVFTVQLLLNALWTPLFFGGDLYGLAFLDIVALWLALVATIVLFARHHRLAAALLLPYLAWVTFAAALNFAIWR
jgi:translocator protein